MYLKFSMSRSSTTMEVAHIHLLIYNKKHQSIVKQKMIRLNNVLIKNITAFKKINNWNQL